MIVLYMIQHFGLLFILLFPEQIAGHASFLHTGKFHDGWRNNSYLPRFSVVAAQKRCGFQWDFNPICKGLIQQNIRFSLLYPAKLCVYFVDRSKLFEFPQEALDFGMVCPWIQMKLEF